MTAKALRRIGWPILGAVCGALYGVVNDQLTVTLAPEYFSVFKRAQFWQPLTAAGLDEAPVRLQAVLVGTLATWWFGLILGILLSFAGLAGRILPLRTAAYLRAIHGVMALALCLSAVCGALAWLAEPAVNPTPNDWPFLAGIHDVRAAFAVGWWHNGAYLGGLIGTIAAAVWVRRQRRVSPPASAPA